MSYPSTSTIFRVVQGIIRITNGTGDAIAGIITDRLKVDAGLSREHDVTITPSLTKNTKYSLALENDLTGLRFCSRPNTKLVYIEYAFSETEFDAGNTFRLDEGEKFSKDHLLFSAKTLYFSVDKDNAILQIEQFYN